MKTLIPILLASAAFASPAFAEEQGAAVAAITPEQIQALQAQIQALQAQVNQLSAAQAATDTKVSSIPTSAPKTDLPGWIKGTSISGKAYANISSIDHESDGVDLSDNGTQTELKRFYFTVDHKFDDMFSANLTTDFRYNANGTSKDVLVYVKKAYLQAKFAPQLFVRVGSADLPWVPFAEGIYGYRFVENVVIDRTKFGTSADWGVHAGGTFGDGLVNYAVSAVNGAGYKTLSRSSNTIDLEGRVDVHPIKPITLAVGGYSGKLGKSADNGVDTRRATRWNVLAAYTDKRVRAGVEYFWAKNWNNVVSEAAGLPTPTDESNGWSAFGSFAVTPQIALFGRYDWVKPSKEINPDLKDRYFNVGVNYKPIPQIDLALVYKRDRAKNGFLSTSNGTIGGLDRGTYDEVGLFTQLAF
jgi:hypothetical protein